MENGVGISVIIPVYKAEPYIKKCLESVLNQTFTDLQIIVINDGTPDNSMKIVEDLQKCDDRIEIVNKENGGVANARNFGIKLARGKYIHFLDSDDYLSRDAYNLCWNLAESTNADVVRSLVSKEFADAEEESVICTGIDINDPFSKILYFQGLFIRRDILIDRELFFPPFKLAEDICFNYTVQINSNKIEYLNEVTYHWVQYPVPFNQHKYDDHKSRIDMLRACDYIISKMLDCNFDNFDSAVTGFIDHFFTHEYDAQWAFSKALLLEYSELLERITRNIKFSYRVPGLYKEKFHSLYQDCQKHITFLKIFKFNFLYFGYFQIRKRGILDTFKKCIKKIRS